MKPIIVALRQRTRELLSAELDRSCKGRLKHLSADDRKSLQVMMDAAVNKLLHAPTQQLKQMASSARSGDGLRIRNYSTLSPFDSWSRVGR